ncbi:MAG: D-Ala-D-Ala carboxypeptidase family metallohydrolase [Bacteroidales bacterium]|nr:D-Ala-D-Ala carboxypeptidase family metallohydrolase [Bacteroidales bacterium]
MSIEAYSVLRQGNQKLSEHFKVREFRCKDGSDPVFIDSELVELLEKIRVHFGKPVTITSGFRTAAHNATVAKAAKYSQHLYGKAADIRVEGISVESVAAYAETLLARRGGIGIYPPGLGRANGWVHVDVRKAKSRWKG